MIYIRVGEYKGGAYVQLRLWRRLLRRLTHSAVQPQGRPPWALDRVINSLPRKDKVMSRAT